ncbi:hypothetical protein [Pantanalinema sp. GBBB05]|uniref:hypothetical protein n=1 Tax=Pantanalinema sp. GBBB05 TaxID=2604139 RepID=UPI003D812D94
MPYQSPSRVTFDRKSQSRLTSDRSPNWHFLKSATVADLKTPIATTAAGVHNISHAR